MSSSVIEVSLSKLVARQANVRPTGVNDGLVKLAASIAAHGLLQPLHVVAREDGRYEVVAGSRRLAALKLLAKAKTIPRGLAVPVLVCEVGEEEGLAENMVRMTLHLADQYEAFAGWSLPAWVRPISPRALACLGALCVCMAVTKPSIEAPPFVVARAV